MSVFELNGLRIIDLAKHIDPATEPRLCEVERTYPTPTSLVPGYGTKLTVTSHLGTHVECPTHQHENWPSCGELPLSNFIGRGVYITMPALPPRTVITYEQMEEACGGKLREGDILVLDSPYRLEPFTPASNTEADKRLIVGTEAANWLVDHKIKAIGFGDGISVESGAEGTTWQFHEICLAKNIVFVEVLKNLDKLSGETFLFAFLPLPIVGLDSSCVWAVAIEGIPGF